MSDSFDSIETKLMKDWFAPTQDRILYHYTNAEGVMGILRSDVLRGTSAGYMNDTSEIRYGLAVCEAVIEHEIRVRSRDAERKLLEGARAGVQSPEIPFEVFVTSFTEARDDLPQWRTYGSPESGYALGFQLSDFCSRDFLRLPKRVEYVRETQETQVRDAIRAVLSGLPEAGGRQEILLGASALMFHLRRLACIFKHPGFSSEREWRSVETVKDHDRQKIELQVVRGILKPYVGMLSGSRISGLLPLVELRVGYATHGAQAIHSAHLLLNKCGYGNARLEVTEIPYRP